MSTYTLTDPALSAPITLTLSPPPPPPPVPVALGAWTPNSGPPWNQSSASAYTALVGTPPAILHWYQDLAHAPTAFDVARCDEAAAAGAIPMISWELDDYQAGASQPFYANAGILSGAHDAALVAWLTAAGVWGKPFLLRFMWEASGKWYPWAAGTPGNTPGSFLDAFRHGTRLARAHTPLARIVWNVSVDLPGLVPLEDVYPGDAYCDVVSLDGYNTGPAGWTGAWRSFADVFGSSYDRLVALAPSKPILLAEVGCAAQGGDQAAWIGEIPAALTAMPNVRGLVWFNNTAGALDFRFTGDPASLAAFQALAKESLLAGHWGG